MTKRYLVNGCDRYAIRFVLQPAGYYKLYADEHPPDTYGKGVSENHLYPSGEVCVTAGQEPYTLDRARAIAKYWCDGWSVYCRTGKFPTHGARVNV